ncbi:MAG TPA: sugar ABC transporter permease [Pseudonocardiaceae bacterium]|nr:sugar ABC transporter permease [Pseudonocardiaceae bacterium]
MAATQVPAGAVRLPAGRRRESALARTRSRIGALYATPLAVLVTVLFVVPLGLMLWMSVNHWPLLGASTPNGFDNYRVLADPLFLQAIWFTLKYTVVTTVVLSLVALGLALLVQERRRGVGVVRTVFFLPTAVGLASASLLFYDLFVTEGSPLNALARWLHLTTGTVDWLGTSNHALLSVVGMITWRFAGFYMLILLTGLHSIDPMLYDAARADGANRWQILRGITLPLLRPSIALMLILSVTGSLLAFDQFFILTGGRHDTATAVIAIYRQAFIRQDLGGAVAISVVVLAVLLIINGVQLLVLRRNDNR